MEKLFIMPSHVPAEALPQEDRRERSGFDRPPAALDSESADSAVFEKSLSNLRTAIDLSGWLSAPRERTPTYFPVYSTVSRAMQAALRHWAREWLHQHPEAFERRIAVYSLLVFSCTRPYRGRPTHIFTYDLQQTATLDQAFRTAGRLLAEELQRIGNMQEAAGEHGPMRPRSRQIQRFVGKNRRLIYRMFHVETALTDEVLKFTQINIPKLGLERAAADLRSGFKRNLRRFSDVADFEDRAGDLLRIATEALRTGLDEEAAMLVAV